MLKFTLPPSAQQNKAIAVYFCIHYDFVTRFTDQQPQFRLQKCLLFYCVLKWHDSWPYYKLYFEKSFEAQNTAETVSSNTVSKLYTLVRVRSVLNLILS